LIHGQEAIHELAPHINGCHMDVPIRSPIAPMVTVPRLDPKVQVHKVAIETFVRFDNLQHGFEEQNPPIIEPLENPQTNFNILGDQGQHEVIMDSTIIKASTPLFCSIHSITITNADVQNFGIIVDLAQRWSKCKWPNSKCIGVPKLEVHYWKVAVFCS